MPDVTLDSLALYAALDAKRQSNGITWKKVADEAGVSASTLTRMAQGKRPDANSLAALLAWSGLDITEFLREDGAPVHPPEPDPLAKITAYLRSDPHLTQEGAIALEQLLKATYERLRIDPEKK
jgi:transcriptional regulator with XRE-family HTH domain